MTTETKDQVEQIQDLNRNEWRCDRKMKKLLNNLGIFPDVMEA